jgi:hypothetical protein
MLILILQRLELRSFVTGVVGACSSSLWVNCRREF